MKEPGGLPTAHLTAVPGCPVCGTGCLHGYGRAPTDEALAWLAWREVIEAAFAQPSLSVVVGAAFGSLLAHQLGTDGFLLHVYGSLTTDRALALRSAASVAGDPEAILRSVVDGDDALHVSAAASPSPVVLAENESGPPPLPGSLPGILVSSGPTPAEGEGVLNVRAPMPRHRVAAAGIASTASRHYGWPVSWLEAAPLDGELHTWFETALNLLGAQVDPPDAHRLALAAVGFGVLGRLARRGFSFYAGIGAAMRVSENDRWLRNSRPPASPAQRR